MTTPYLAADIDAEEGLRLEAYPDPLTHGAPWTIGYGCTGPDIGPDTVWTVAQAMAARDARIAEIEAGFDHAIPWWRNALNDVRQDVLVQMGYQLGVEGTLEFHHLIAALKASEWGAAFAAMNSSRWARQTTGREQRLARQLLTGVRATA